MITIRQLTARLHDVQVNNMITALLLQTASALIMHTDYGTPMSDPKMASARRMIAYRWN